MINTKVVSIITLDVEVPNTVDVRDFDEAVMDYSLGDSEGLEYSEYVDVHPTDIMRSISGNDNEVLCRFLNDVRDVLRPIADKIDTVHFWR